MHQHIREFVRDLAARENGPFYVYDTAVVREKCRLFQGISYPHKSIHFASMANANPDVLKVVRDAGLNVFVNSVGHLEIAQRLGWTREQIVYTASAMNEGDMRAAHAAGAVVHLDSVGQLELWSKLFPGEPAGIRCNIGTLVSPRSTRGGYFLGPESRLGLTVQEIEGLAGSPMISGLHLYLGTDIVEAEYFRECYEHIIRLASLFPALKHLDFGGGFGVPTAERSGFDFDAYHQFVPDLMGRVSRDAGRPVKLILEPGRIICAESGYFVVRVTDVKQRNGRQLLGVHGSTAQFSRPLLYPDSAYHPVEIVHTHKPLNGSPHVQTSVYGCSTYSRDFLARDVELPELHVGDLIAFGHAGAYCASSHTSFLGFAPAKEYLT